MFFKTKSGKRVWVKPSSFLSLKAWQKMFLIKPTRAVMRTHSISLEGRTIEGADWSKRDQR